MNNTGDVKQDRRALTAGELRDRKTARRYFQERRRNPITVVLDGVVRNYNIGAIFRLCDAFLIERLIICGVRVQLHKRKLVQAAQGTQRWVPWLEQERATDVVRELRAAGAWILVAELTTDSVQPKQLTPRFPAALVLGGERGGVSSPVLRAADAAVAIPMLGMANSLNVTTAAAILLYELSRSPRPQIIDPDAIIEQ